MSKKKQHGSTAILLLTAFFTLSIGFGLGVLVRTLYPRTFTSIAQLRQGGYQYINPIIDFESVSAASKYELNRLGYKLENFEKALKKDSNTKNVLLSVYYKDLNSGAWVGINQDTKFEPASLFKVPTMIVNYKIAQEDPTFLNLKTEYHHNSNQDILEQVVSVENDLIEGEEYTLEEYIEQLIIYSDNRVLDEIEELYRKGTTENQYQIFSDLGLQDPFLSDDYNIITTKEYASFFRILYNASYLNKEMSSKALELLTKTRYDDGLRGGVPEEIKIAKKFGERTMQILGRGKIVQLHDCGIVYHPSQPYILCVMTQGDNITPLSNIIQSVSSIVYESVER